MDCISLLMMLKQVLQTRANSIPINAETSERYNAGSLIATKAVVNRDAIFGSLFSDARNAALTHCSRPSKALRQRTDAHPCYC